MPRAHMPSDADRESQKAAKPTHERSFGGMASGGMPSVSHSPSEVDRLDQSRNSPVLSKDGLGKMSNAMGGKRSDATTPAAPPTQRKRKPGGM